MRQLIRYAGFDEKEAFPGYYPSRQELRGTGRRQRAYVMFRAGRDTFDIAEAMKVEEHRVLEWISIERSEHKRRPSPYFVGAAI
jgi:hypothetical protein